MSTLSEYEDQTTSSSDEKSVKVYYPDDFGSLDIRIGKILDVRINPYAKKKKPCYVANVDVGEDIPRCIGSELNHFYKEEELINRLVVVLCNAVTKKKCNLLSEAWIITAHSDEHTLELLDPPPGCEEGEQVTVKGFPTIPDIRDVAYPRLSMTMRIMQEVRVSEAKVAEYRRVPLKVEGRDLITTQTLADCMVTDSFIKFKFKY